MRKYTMVDKLNDISKHHGFSVEAIHDDTVAKNTDKTSDSNTLKIKRSLNVYDCPLSSNQSNRRLLATIDENKPNHLELFTTIPSLVNILVKYARTPVRKRGGVSKYNLKLQLKNAKRKNHNLRLELRTIRKAFGPNGLYSQLLKRNTEVHNKIKDEIKPTDITDTYVCYVKEPGFASDLTGNKYVVVCNNGSVVGKPDLGSITGNMNCHLYGNSPKDIANKYHLDDTVGIHKIKNVEKDE